MRVLIVGEGKSGTTALMRSVATCLVDPVTVFEPPKMTAELLEPDSLVVKKLLMQYAAKERPLFRTFDKRILIVRDPRDRLISHLLYDAYNQAPKLTQSQRDGWIDTLQEKVADPASMRLTTLINSWWKLAGTDLLSSYMRAIGRVSRFQRMVGRNFHHLAYEDYVEGNFDAINSYLDLVIESGVVTGDEERVVRSKASGAWRDWFTEADIEVFEPLTNDWSAVANPVVAKWDLNAPASIDSATSIGYVQSLFDRVPLPA